MLIITRKNGQKIMINDDIEITIVESKNGTCKVAIQAPKSFKIYREEIYVQIKLANLMGQESSPALLDQASALLSKKDVKLNTQLKTIDTDEEIVVKDSPKKEGKTRVFIKKRNND
ncbi:MAG: carbon storage regulator [Candidatus Gastranaerophilaceae bacterium]